jgi:nucleotide-binding universal stress UspA family protein
MVISKIKTVTKKANYLVCVNREKYSEVALHFAAKLAKNNDGSVIILHVIEPHDYQSFGGVAETIRAETIQEAENLLASHATKVNKWTNITPVLIVKEGLIENEIISLVTNDPSINMLIVGAASATSIKSKILPPLVSSLGSKLAIPMMIIPGNMTTKQIEDLT